MSLACNISLNVSHASTICVDLIEHCQVGKMAENITIVGGFWGCLVLEGFGRDDSFQLQSGCLSTQPGIAIYYNSEATEVCPEVSNKGCTSFPDLQFFNIVQKGVGSKRIFRGRVV